MGKFTMFNVLKEWYRYVQNKDTVRNPKKSDPVSLRYIWAGENKHGINYEARVDAVDLLWDVLFGNLEDNSESNDFVESTKEYGNPELPTLQAFVVESFRECNKTDVEQLEFLLEKYLDKKFPNFAKDCIRYRMLEVYELKECKIHLENLEPSDKILTDMIDKWSKEESTSDSYIKDVNVFSQSMEEITTLITETNKQVQTIVKDVFTQIQNKTIQIEFSVGSEKKSALEELTETIRSSNNLADLNIQSLQKTVAKIKSEIHVQMPVNIITGNKGSVEVVMGDKNTAKEGASIQTGEGDQTIL